MARQYPPGLDAVQAVERRDRLRGLRGIRRDHRPGLPVRDRDGGERVADQEGVACRDMEGRAPRRVTREVDDRRGARDVEGDAIAVGRDLADVDRLEAAPTQAEEHEPQERDRADRTAASRRVLHLAAGQCGVELVDRHREAALGPGALGEADVVGVPVGQDDGPDVVQGATHRRQLGQQVRPVAGHPRVDDRDAAGLLEEVHIDQARAESTDPVGDLHRPIVPPAVRPRPASGEHENARRNRRSLAVPINTSTNRITRCSRPLRARSTVRETHGPVQRYFPRASCHRGRDRARCPRRFPHPAPGRHLTGTLKRPKEPRSRSLRRRCKHLRRHFRSRGPFGQDLL